MSLAFRHFGNVAGGGVITSILYTALAGLSTAILGLIASNGVAVSAVLLAAGIGLFLLGIRKKKLGLKILGGVCAVLGIFGMLQVFGVLSDVPLLQFGVPAVLSLYFGLFSGFIQALVFSLLTMVYISGACPPPEEATEA